MCWVLKHFIKMIFIVKTFQINIGQNGGGEKKKVLKKLKIVYGINKVCTYVIVLAIN